MLTEAFPQLKERRAVIGVRNFFRSGWFAALAALLMACSEIFGLEIFVIYAYLVFGLLIVLFADDMLGIVPDWWNRIWIPLCKLLPTGALRPLRRHTMKFQK